jgi:hypothetical protein
MDLTIFPPGTNFFEPNEVNEVTIQFPDKESAIVFYEFMRSFINEEITLIAEDKIGKADD